MAIMELHQLLSLCRSETDAFNIYSKRKKNWKEIPVPCNGDRNSISWSQEDSGAVPARWITIRSTIPGFCQLRISCVSWFLLIKLFELEMSARKASIELGLSYPTTLKGFDILRGVILQELSRSDDVLRGEIEADESYFGRKRKV